MRRVLFAAAFVLTGALVAAAQDPKPAQPERPKVQPGQPLQPRATTVTATKMLQLEEDLETLEAHREVKKAYVKAAEVAVEAARARNDLVGKPAGVVPGAEMMAAKYDLEAAKAQLDIRAAELKEVEVKVKYAKKRLEDAKAAGVRPAPARPADPKATDPPPAAK